MMEHRSISTDGINAIYMLPPPDDDDGVEELNDDDVDGMANNQDVVGGIANNQFPPPGLWDHYGQQGQYLGADSPMAAMAGAGYWPWAGMHPTQMGLTGMNYYHNTPWMDFYS